MTAGSQIWGLQVAVKGLFGPCFWGPFRSSQRNIEAPAFGLISGHYKQTFGSLFLGSLWGHSEEAPRPLLGSFRGH